MKILIVEDDAGISDFIIPELDHEGYETCLAVSGREALSKFESDKPDLILLDIMLPELNGLEASGVLEQRHHRLASLVLHQCIRIDGRLCGLAVLLPLMNQDRIEI